jgi:hypothetical protein
MDNFVFVSVAFGPRYVAQIDRLENSILDIYPEANILFWRDELPPGSQPFLESFYGFKVHAIQQAFDQGYTRVLWLDPAVILKQKIDHLYGKKMAAVMDENLLASFISDDYIGHNKETREQIKKDGLHLVGGSLYYFDFYYDDAIEIFLNWKSDEMLGYFGNQEDEAAGKQQGHCADESCMAFNMYQQGIKPMSPETLLYCSNPDVMDSREWVFVKKHFK